MDFVQTNDPLYALHYNPIDGITVELHAESNL